MQLPAECQNPDAVSTKGLAQDWIPGLAKNLIPQNLLPEATFSTPDQLRAAGFWAGPAPVIRAERGDTTHDLRGFLPPRKRT